MRNKIIISGLLMLLSIVSYSQVYPCTQPNGSMVQILNFKPFPIQTGDQLEYDILLNEKSKTDAGHLTIRRGTGRPLFLNRAVDQFGQLFSAKYFYGDAVGNWAHRVVWIGHGCPEGANVLGFLITGNDTGICHFYLDNIVVRRRDGSSMVIWQQGMPVSGELATKEISELRVSSVPAFDGKNP
jgi:hypothetical protein